MMTKEQAMEMVRNLMLEYQPNMNLSEGSLCYDLISPLAYVYQGYQVALEDYMENFDLTNADLSHLRLWATSRIGEPKKATPTTLLIQSTDGSPLEGTQWILSTMNYSFVKTEAKTTNQIYIQSTLSGISPIRFSKGLHLQSEKKEVAEVVEVVSYGTNEENAESYRRRYLSSFLMPMQAGLGSYYKERFQDYSYVGYAAVDYPQSQLQEKVVVVAISPDFKTLTEEERHHILSHFVEEEEIVPLGQSLEVTSIPEMTFYLKIQMNSSSTIPLKLIQEYLSRLNQEVYLFQEFNSKTLSFTISYLELATKLKSQFSEYGVMEDIFLNNKKENLNVNHVIPKWEVSFIG